MKCLGSSGVCILDIYVHIFTCAGLVSQVETDAEQSPGTGRDAEGEKELRASANRSVGLGYGVKVGGVALAFLSPKISPWRNAGLGSSQGGVDQGLLSVQCPGC